LDDLQPVAGALLVEMPQIIGGVLGPHKELGVKVLDAGGFAPAPIHLIGHRVQGGEGIEAALHGHTDYIGLEHSQGGLLTSHRISPKVPLFFL